MNACAWTVAVESIRTLSVWAIAGGGSSCPPCTCNCAPSLACPGGVAHTSPSAGVTTSWTSGFLVACAAFVAGSFFGERLVHKLLQRAQSVEVQEQHPQSDFRAAARAQLAVLGYGGGD